MRAACAALLLCALGALAQPQPEGPSGRQGQRDAARATRFMVAAANPHAVDAGLEMLRAGGSALDAAIAAQMVLGLVEPQSSGIGGGAFLLHWSQREKRLRSYDGRETAPAAAREPPAMASGAAVGVPGVLRMLEQAHRRHGRLAWARLFGPAIRLAEEGFPVSPRLNRLLEAESELRKAPLFYPGGRALAAGARLANHEYAMTLRAIAARGAAALYRGPIAEDIVRAIRTHASPGDMTLADLAGYQAVEREPVCLAYRVARVCSMGPPGGGVTVLQILGILDRAGFHGAPPNSALALHLFAEAGRLAYADRVRHVGDPRFVAVPVAGLLEPGYLGERARRIGERSMGHAEPGRPRGASALVDSPESTLAATSHLVVVDQRGDAISMTTTIESAFGSRILVRGFLLNNQLTDFTSQEGAANRLEPGKRPRSAMSPTMVFGADGRLQAALGSPGGAPIINYVARTLVAMLDWKLDAQSALALPNGGSLNGPTYLESGSLYELLAPALRERGHEVRLVDLTSGIQAIQRVPGGWRGGADPRREGVARGD